MAKKKEKVDTTKIKEEEIVESIEIATEPELIVEAIEEPIESAPIEKEDDIFPEPKSIPELILNYINSQEGEEVELNDYFISLYSVPESMWVSKDIKYCLDRMIKDKQITLANNRYYELGMTYYDRYGVAKKHSILDVKILAKK